MNRVALLVTGVPDLGSGGAAGWCLGEELRVPALQALRARGQALTAELPAGSSGVLELLGVGRQPWAASALLAAIGHEVSLEGAELLLRCDLVTTSDGRIVDRLDGKLTDQEGRLLIAALDQRLGNDLLHFCPGSQQRHFLVIRDVRAWGSEPEGMRPNEWPPVNRSTARHLQRGRVDQLVRRLAELAERAADVLDGHEVNHVRLDLHENPANDLWIWDGVRPATVTVTSPVSFDAFVTTTDYLVGLAKVLDIQVVAGHRRQDAADALRADAATLQRLMLSTDRLLMHVDLGPWAAATTGRRVRLVEQVDRLLVGPLREQAERSGIRLAVVLLGPAIKQMADAERQRCRCQAVMYDGGVPVTWPADRPPTEVFSWLCRSSD